MRRPPRIGLGALAAVAILHGQVSMAAEPPITVAWREKPPYHYTDQGMPTGFLLDRTRQIFAAAGIAAHFVNEPQKRIWANFEHGASNYCSISWYKLPERERVGNYSLPIHADPPQSVLAAPGAVRQITAHPTLASLLADTSLTLGVVDGVSYGPDWDALIAHSANIVMRRTVDTTGMMRMLSVGRASFMLVDRADWEFFRLKDKAFEAMVRVDFPDMPAGMMRHIVCSKDVLAETMERINQAIAITGGASDAEDKKAKPKK
jgi:uncharacterized protein (TIGR02285 family)